MKRIYQTPQAIVVERDISSSICETSPASGQNEGIQYDDWVL